MSMPVQNVYFKGETPHINGTEECNSQCSTKEACAVKLETPPDSVDFSTKNVKETKKTSWGGAVASFFLPGLGQLCQGRAKDGLVDLLTGIGLGVLGGLGSVMACSAKNMASLLGTGAALVGGIGFIINQIHSIVDAAKNGEKAQKAQ